MTLFQTQYLPVYIFRIVGFALSAIIFGASYLVATHAGDTQKSSAYECGFDPYDDARTRFDVRFYLVAILFIVFDLEASFLFPWCVSLGNLGSNGLGFWSMVDFLGELTIGFVYAWKVGALEW